MGGGGAMVYIQCSFLNSRQLTLFHQTSKTLPCMNGGGYMLLASFG